MFGAFTDAQQQLREIVREYFQDKSPESEVRRLMDAEEGYDPVVWRQMATEVGLQGIAIPEAYGGQGAGWTELGIVMEEAGRALLCAPLFSTAVLATTALLESGDEAAKQRYLPPIADGSCLGTVVLAGENGHWDIDDAALPATPAEGGWTVRGVRPFVLDGATAGLIIVPATTEHGLSLFAVEADAAGVSAHPSKTLDETRKLATVEFADAPANLIGAEGDGRRILGRVLDFAAVALAAEQAGGAQAALDMSVEYLNSRVQFGQLIGAFQALKHMAADVHVEVESAKSAAYYALAAAEADNDELPAAASLAQAYCSDAFVTAAHQNIQFHGGMGFTWEVPAHLYFKRARSSEVFLGDATVHREALAERIGI